MQNHKSHEGKEGAIFSHSSSTSVPQPRVFTLVKNAFLGVKTYLPPLDLIVLSLYRDKGEHIKYKTKKRDEKVTGMVCESVGRSNAFYIRSCSTSFALRNGERVKKMT